MQPPVIVVDIDRSFWIDASADDRLVPFSCRTFWSEASPSL
jgi:hypothetical protein